MDGETGETRPIWQPRHVEARYHVTESVTMVSKLDNRYAGALGNRIWVGVFVLCRSIQSALQAVERQRRAHPQSSKSIRQGAIGVISKSKFAGAKWVTTRL